MPNSTNPSPESATLTPEQRLEPLNPKLIDAGIAPISDMNTLRACIAYENTHQNRLAILQLLDSRANELRAQDD